MSSIGYHQSDFYDKVLKDPAKAYLLLISINFSNSRIYQCLFGNELPIAVKPHSPVSDINEGLWAAQCAIYLVKTLCDCGFGLYEDKGSGI